MENSSSREQTASSADVNNLHQPHPRIRAEDWRSPLVSRLLGSDKYKDSTCVVNDSYKAPDDIASESSLNLRWSDLKTDFERCVNTYQGPVLTEYAALGIACILLHQRPRLEITEVTRRGEKVDYWLGDRELLLEVSGSQNCNLQQLCEDKAENQLLKNPFGKNGYVCVTDFSTKTARLWYYKY